MFDIMAGSWPLEGDGIGVASRSRRVDREKSGGMAEYRLLTRCTDLPLQFWVQSRSLEAPMSWSISSGGTAAGTEWSTPE